MFLNHHKLGINITSSAILFNLHSSENENKTEFMCAHPTQFKAFLEGLWS